MSLWLAKLPHQIPFRAASRISEVDATTVEGAYLVSSSDALTMGEAAPQFLLVEAMAQAGGMLAFRGSSEPGFLSAIDSVQISGPMQPGDEVQFTVRLQASFGRIHKLEGTAWRQGEELARVRFYLAASEERSHDDA